MYNQLIAMFDQMLEIDFNETPNLKAMLAIRDRLLEEYGDAQLANGVVAGLELDVSAASLEQAAELGNKFAEVLVKFIDVMYDNGFDNKHIITMAGSQMNLKYS